MSGRTRFGVRRPLPSFRTIGFKDLERKKKRAASSAVALFKGTKLIRRLKTG